MRTFSLFEKEILTIIAKDNPSANFRQNFYTLIKNIFINKPVEFLFIKNTKEIKIVLELQEDKRNASDVSLCASKFIELMVLIKYLEDNNLIALYSFDEDDQFEESTSLSGPLLEQTIIDTSIYDFYKNRCNKFIYCTEELRDIVLNKGFKSEEQIATKDQLTEAKKQTKYAKETMVVSFVVLFISIVSIFISNLNTNKSHETNKTELIMTNKNDSIIDKIK